MLTRNMNPKRLILPLFRATKKLPAGLLGTTKAMCLLCDCYVYTMCLVPRGP